ncbi:MAG: indole-3-glycerol phosphate synthase [Myxococcota bacterium]|jgi:indole-3-glycerol phosphate synthase
MKTPGLLDQMNAHSAERVRALRSRGPLARLRRQAMGTAPAPALVLSGFDVLAEVKWRSPSEGALALPRDLGAETALRAIEYAEAGAAAVSVLTEPLRFGGDLSLLTSAAGICPVPVMRKDFLVDPIQVYEARAAGAGGVLLIVRSLSDALLADMLGAAAECGLFVLIEAFDAADLARLPPLPPGTLVGVNTRDLVTLAVDPSRLADLVGLIPKSCVPVAESGMLTPADVGAAGALGYRMALVGSALMRSADPAVLVAQMKEAGRCS